MFHVTIKDDVAKLKREGNYEQALSLLMQSIGYTEDQYRKNSRPLYVWPYEQAAIIYAKMKKPLDEIAIIERYIFTNGRPDRNNRKLYGRLVKAYIRAGLAFPDPGNKKLAIHKTENTRLDLINKFLRYGLIVDTETTGLSKRDEIIEFAALLFEFSLASGEITGVKDTYSDLRQPNVPISPEAQAVHGIKKRHLRGKRLDDNYIRTLFAKSSIMIAHNAPFDYRFISKMYPEVQRKVWFCTMNGIYWKGKGHRSKSLQNLQRAYGLGAKQSHRGKEDVLLVYELLKLREKSGGGTLFMELMDGFPIRI